jgi:hypothetical protein
MAQVIEVPNYGQVEFPDDMTDEQIVSAIKKTSMGYKPAMSRTDKMLKGVRDPIDAGAQLLTKMLPDSVANAGNQLNNYLADKTGLVSRLPEGGVSQQINEQEASYQDQRTQSGEEGFDGYRLLGNVVSPANLALASKLPAAATLAGKVGTGALGGGALAGLTQPVVGDGDFLTEKAKQVGVGAITGGVTPAFVGGVARVVSPKASVNPNIQKLRSEGVNPTIGQTLGGGINKIEERMQSVPILGDMITRARGQANSQFEKAAFNRSLKPIGQKLPEGLAGREAVDYVESTLGQSYDDVLTRIGAITPDQQFNTKLSDLKKLVSGKMMPKAEKAKFLSAVQDIKDTAKDGVITSEAFKELESSLGSQARKLGGSQNVYEGKLAPAVKQLQQELRDMLQRQAGDAADELRKVNTGYSNFKRVQNAATKLGADDGSFTPAQFQNAVRAMDKSKDKAAFAKGNALGQDLGDAGKSVLSGKVPNSGTAERVMYGTGALASGALNPAIPAGLLGGAALYTQPMQKVLTSLVAKRPERAAELAEFIRQNGNYVLPATGAVGAGLLN